MDLPTSSFDIKKGDLIEVTIEKVEGLGKAIARIGQLVVFVDKGLPGEIRQVQVIKKKPRYLETISKAIIQEAPSYVAAPCPWFGICGGCVWQNASYETQLTIKEGIVRDALEHIGKLELGSFVLNPIIGSPKQWYYRNKIELSFGVNEEDSTDIGFRKKGSYTGVLPINSCHIFSEKFPAFITILRTWVQSFDFTSFDIKKFPDGFWQYCMIRRSEYKKEWMINFITRDHDLPDITQLVEDLNTALEDEKITSIYHTKNSGGVGYSHHEDKVAKLLYGQDHITDHLEGLSFTISPFSFFQTNTFGAEKLFGIVREKAALQDSETLLDAYCGTGTIGQFLAQGSNAKIIGIEIVPEAIEAARENAKINGLSNVEYFAGDANVILRELRGTLNVDCIVLDPPRAGLSFKALQKILDLNAKRIIYVSCNPATLARDIQYIHEHSAFKLEEVTPVDMFPHTSHVECVAVFSKKL